MSKKDTFALLKALGYPDLPSDELLSGVNEATGERLLAKAMKSINERKLGSAEKLRDSRTEVSSGLGALGNILSRDAGGRRVSALNKTMAANAEKAAKAETVEAGYADQLARDEKREAWGAQNLQHLQHGQTIQGRLDVANANNRQSNINSLRTAATAAAARSDARAAAQVKRHDTLMSDTSKFAEDIRQAEDYAKPLNSLAEFFNEHPDTNLEMADISKGIDYTLSVMGEASAGFEVLDHVKDAETLTFKREKHNDGVRNQAVARADEIISAANGDLSADDQALLDALIAETPGIEGYTGDSNVDNIERRHRMQERAQREGMSEEEIRIADNAIETGSADELNQAYNSTRTESNREYMAEVGLKNTDITEMRFNVSGGSLDAAQRKTPEEKELYWRYKQAVVARVMKIAATTFTDEVKKDIMQDFGMYPEVGPRAMRNAVSIMREGALNELHTIANGVKPEIRNQYKEWNKESALNHGIANIEQLPGEDPPSEAPGPNQVIGLVNNSGGTPMRYAKETDNVPAAAALDATGAPSAAGVLGQGVRQLPFIGEEAGNIIDSVKSLSKPPENREPPPPDPDNRQGSVLKKSVPNAMDIFKTPKNDAQANVLAQTIAIIQSQSQLGPRNA